MTENNSPSDAENQEQKSEKAPPSQVDPKSENPSEEKNQEDTEPPPPPAKTHGWLEQFDLLKVEAIAEIEAVTKGGLEETEVDLLCYLSVKLAHIAQSHNSDSLAKIRAHLDY